jgi:hypothetical protein
MNSSASKWGTADDFIRMAQQYLTFVEALFGDPGLAALRRRYPKHPAVGSYDAVAANIRRLPQFNYTDLTTDLKAVSRMMIEVSTWAGSGTNLSSLEHIVPSENARKKMLTRLRNPSQYEDIFSELFWLGWMRVRGWSADLEEIEGRPDIVITAPAEVQAEVKRIGVGTKPRRVESIISSASKQIERADPDGSGLVLIIVERVGGRASLDDRIPNDVARYVAAARKKIESRTGSKGSRAAGALVILWDDLRIHFAPERGRLVCVWRRRSVTVRHANPKTRVPDELLPANIGMTVAHAIEMPNIGNVEDLSPWSREIGGIHISDDLWAINEFGTGLTAPHLLEIYEEPDASINHEVDKGLTIQLLVREARIRKREVVVVLCAAKIRGRVLVFNALQLLGDRAARRVWRDSPDKAFETALERYALPFRINGVLARFAEVVVVSQFSLPEVGIEVAYTGFAAQRLTTTASGTIQQMAWLHFIDENRYRSAVTTGLDLV